MTAPAVKVVRRPRSTWAILIVVAVLVALTVLMALGWLFFRDSRIGLEPRYFVGAEGQSSISLLVGATDVTDTTCAELQCESAWGTDHLVLMKFTTKDSAAVAARNLGRDAYRSDWLVAHFSDTVSATDRRHTAEALDGAWQSKVE